MGAESKAVKSNYFKSPVPTDKSRKVVSTPKSEPVKRGKSKIKNSTLPQTERKPKRTGNVRQVSGAEDSTDNLGASSPLLPTEGRFKIAVELTSAGQGREDVPKGYDIIPKDVEDLARGVESDGVACETDSSQAGKGHSAAQIIREAAVKPQTTELLVAQIGSDETGDPAEQKVSSHNALSQVVASKEQKTEGNGENDEVGPVRSEAGDRVQGLANGDRKNRRKKEAGQRKLKAMEENQRKRGVCYISRVPPHMKPLKLRHLLEPYGEILRIYLAPEDAAIRLRRKRAGGDRGKKFTEGWVEFGSKKNAKRVAALLNGEAMEMRKRSAYHYDLWNIKYLHKFKWDNLTEEIAYKTAVREQKLAAELSKATKERDFYLSRVDQSRAIKAMAERKRKRGGEASKGELKVDDSKASKKIVRRFAQREVVHDPSTTQGPRLSTSLLKKVWGEEATT